jgi:hypothetical protein
LNGVTLSRTRRVAAISVLTALAITTDYALFPLANVKLMDTIVFVTALVFGLEAGVSVGALTWLVYGTFNPLGADGGLFLVLLMLSETVYAFLAVVARRTIDPKAALPTRSIVWGALGLIGAFLYDLNTIVTPAVIGGAPLTPVSLVILLTPASPFMLAHEASDFVFFATVAPVLYIAVMKLLRRQPQASALSNPTMSVTAPVLSLFGLNLARTLPPALTSPRSLCTRPPFTPSKTTKANASRSPVGETETVMALTLPDGPTLTNFLIGE